jgi:hypothetical protein
MKLQYFLLLPVVFGCTGTEKETGIEMEAFAPSEGNWSFGETAYSTDECNLANNAATTTAIIDALVFTLANVSETEVTLTNAAGIDYSCSLDGMVLTCETTSETELENYTDLDGNEVTDEEGNPVDPDATTTSTLQAVATFTDANTATYSATYTGECSGADCDVILTGLGIATSPCSSEYGGTFTLQE